MNRRRRQNGTGCGFYIFVVGLAALGLIMFQNMSTNQTWLDSSTNPHEAEEATFEISPGQTGKTVAQNLKDQGFIDSYWKFYNHIKDKEIHFQAGKFSLSPAMSPQTIIDTMMGGGSQIKVTIPEGWTIAQIDDRLFNLGLINDDQFEQCTQTCPIHEQWEFLNEGDSLEGYLFPDTYFIDPASFTSEGFIHRLIQTFEKRVLPQISATNRSISDIVIMASIVEREALLDEDYPLIAGILWKRFDNDWSIGADATLLYVLDSSDQLVANLDLDSPYNTRNRRGLPPTAIANPGLTALTATIYPEQSPYWFYLNDQQTGKAHYAVTNEEHNANKWKWL